MDKLCFDTHDSLNVNGYSLEWPIKSVVSKNVKCQEEVRDELSFVG